MGSNNTFGDTNFNPKMSSEPIEEKPKCTLSDYDLIIMATGWVSKLCESGGTKFEMRIPVDYNHDTDMIFTEVIQRFEKANDRISELEKAIRLLLIGLKAENIDQLMLKARPEDYLTYGKLYSNIAQDKLSSLESDNSYLQTQLDIQKRITDGRDRSICDLEDSLHRLESKLKALREERDKFAIGFFCWRFKELDSHYSPNLPAIKKLLEQFKAYTLNTENLP